MDYSTFFVLLFSSASIYYWFYKPDINLGNVAVTILKGTFLLSSVILFYYALLNSLVQRATRYFRGLQVYESVNFRDPTLLNSRNKLQEDYTRQSEDYEKRVLEPRRKIKLAKKEDDHYGERVPFRGEGNTLGGNEDGKIDKERKLPKNVLQREQELTDHRENELVEQRRNQEKFKARKPVNEPITALPDEPDVGDGVVTIALKIPSGKTHRRRFKVEQTMQDLLHYMTTLGFHDSIYTLIMPYPSATFQTDPGLLLKSVGINSDTVLHVQEKD